jgi:PAS domain S-box-containing protein
MDNQVRVAARAFDDLDRFQVAVVRVDSRQRISEASRLARAIARDPLVGRHLTELFPPGSSWNEIKAHLEVRQKGGASEYHVEIVCPGTDTRIPVCGLGIPEVDANGTVVGSIALVRDLREERAARAMHSAIETRAGGFEILKSVAHALAPLVEFDAFRVMAVSKSREHLRTIYRSDSDALYVINRWWTMPKFARHMLADRTPKLIDLKKFFADPEWARVAAEDAATQAYLDGGFKHTLSLPVVENDVVVGFVGIDSKRATCPYDDDTVELLHRLPLREAVLMALHCEEEQRLRFSMDLIAELGRNSHDIHKVSETLVEKLAAHWGWDHVSIFQRDEDSGGFRLLNQAGAGKDRLPDDVALPADEGLVADAFATQEVINTPDVAHEPRYRPGVPGMNSELCMPVPGAVPRWVLNIESKLFNTFAQEEIEAVGVLVREAGFILERAALLSMRTAILESINDAVLETDRRGRIRTANCGAGRLIGVAAAELHGTTLADLLVDQELAAKVIDQGDLPCTETSVRMRDGREVPVLLSGSELPKRLGGRVFVLTDLTYRESLRRIEMLKEVFKQAALETRVPLANAGKWVADLAGEDYNVPAQTIERILKQLGKADLPLERLMRLAGAGSGSAAAGSADLVAIFESVLDELPSTERDSIKYSKTIMDGRVTGSDHALRFCLATMVAFALRTRPIDARVRVTLGAANGRATLKVEGAWIPDFSRADEPGIWDNWRSRAIADFALGEDVLQKLVADGEGSFTSEMSKGLRMQLELPLARTVALHG